MDGFFSSQRWLILLLPALVLGCGGKKNTKEEDDPPTKLVKRYEAALKQTDAQAKCEILLQIAREQLEIAQVTGAGKSLSAAAKAAPSIVNPAHRARIFADISYYETQAKRPSEAKTSLAQAQAAAAKIQNDPVGLCMATGRLAIALQEMKSEGTARDTLAKAAVVAEEIKQSDE